MYFKGGTHFKQCKYANSYLHSGITVDHLRRLKVFRLEMMV